MNIYDVTLRDGNHALRHQLKVEFVEKYCALADISGVWAVEVGHGNGLGASSYLVGKSVATDQQLLVAARSKLKNAKLAVHSIPGFATLNRDLIPAVDLGVDIFRVATHVSEANTAEKHIDYLANKDITVHGVLMMSHMISIDGLISQAKLMQSYGATAVIIMDSSGHFIPTEVRERIDALKNELNIEVGFHAHNNLGVAVSNAVIAQKSGASIIDGASMGLGAGAGNAQLEGIIAVKNRDDRQRDLAPFYKMSQAIESDFAENLPRMTSSSIQSGMAGVFSGYAPQVKALAQELGIEPETLWSEIAKRRLVAGQESMIREIAQDLMNL